MYAEIKTVFADEDSRTCVFTVDAEGSLTTVQESLPGRETQLSPGSATPPWEQGTLPFFVEQDAHKG